MLQSQSPLAQRAMAFIDGSNLLVELGEQTTARFPADRPNQSHLILGAQTVTKALVEQIVAGPVGPHQVLRRYWFGSVQGSDEDLLARKQWLRDQNYEAVLFRKKKGRDEKGVDLAVAREMLMHGFNKNYQTAVLVAGDSDYIGLVQDLKRLGLLVVLAFYECSALSPELRLAADAFVALHHPSAVNSTILAEINGAA
jgi:uncharacterized LabA/DUF88 family protein